MRYRQTYFGNRISLALLIGAWISIEVFAEDLRFTQPEADAVGSDDGSIQLAWETISNLPEPLVYEVVRSGSSDMSDSIVVYEGKDTATFVSGLSEGEYFFQVSSLSVDGDPEMSSEIVTLNVEYIDGQLVVILMSAGMITFLAIVSAIAIGHMKTRKDLEAEV